MQSEPLLSNADLAQIVTKIIQSIRLIPNSVTKIKPFESHFGRPPNTELSNIVIKANKTRLSYHKIRSFVSVKAKLIFPRESIWDLENDSEPELDIRYKDEETLKEDRPQYHHRTRQIQRTRRSLATRAFLVGSHLQNYK